MENWADLRQQMSNRFQQCIVNEDAAQINILLDEDSCKWDSHFDPHLDILFGKGGLSQKFLLGQDYFDAPSYEELPDIVNLILDRYIAESHEAAMDVCQDLMDAGDMTAEPILENKDKLRGEKLQMLKNMDLN